MADAPPPPQPPAGNPLRARFRLVQGRGLGERSTTPSNATPNQVEAPPRMAAASSSSSHSGLAHVQSAPQVQQMANSGQGPSTPQNIVQGQPQHLQPAQQQPMQQGNIDSPMAPAPQGPPTPQIGQPLSVGATPSPATPQQPQPGTPMDEQVVMKCVRFFKTLITLSQQPEQQQEGQGQRQTAAKVHELVSSVIFGSLPAQEFTTYLQEALKSQAQPHLLPFLQRTLPHLREAIRNGDVVIEGIVPPPGFVIGQGAAVNSPQQPAVSQPPPQQMMPQQGQQPQQSWGGPPQHGVPMGMAPVPQQQPQMQQQPEPMDTEETRHDEDVIQVRQLQESALKTALLRPEDIMKKITQRMNEACFVEEEVLTLISDAAEYRLREMLTELSVLAEHRMDPIRMNPNYAQIDNTKAQIRFIEDLDRQQQEQSENRAKEELIRMSKGKGIAKDTIEKAKEMQRQDAEAKRNRDANAAAIAALSSKSAMPKWNSVGGSGGGGHISRPRTIRVNIRDLHALASNDHLCARSQLVHKLALGGGVQAEGF